MKNKITYHDGEQSNLGINPLIEITDIGSTQFAECMDIYKSSFPFNETRPAKKVKEMLVSDRYYHLFA